jgi:acyl carrier protein
MNTGEVASRVRGYITENFLYTRPGFTVGDDDSLLGNGIIDSMGVIEVITFIQEEFSITIEDDDITEENLGTLSAIARYVVGKQAQSKAA